MKRLMLVGVVLLSGSLFAQGQAPAGLPPAQANMKARAENVREIPFTSAGDFLKLPTGLYLGEGIGVARNSKGQIYVYTRSGEASRLFQFDQNGNFMREIGRGSYGFQMAHAVRVDPDDNIWVVDEGTNMVIKFNPEGKVQLVIGRRHEVVEGLIPTSTPVPPAQPYRFNRPTDVAFDAQGNVFVADGYNNSRVVKYDRYGKYVASVGTRGTQPYQFNTPHTIQTDARGNVFVGDRNNGRIQVFDNNLVLRAIYDNVGRPWALCITPGPHQYLYSSNSNPDNNNADLAAITGEIYKMELDGRIVGKFGGPGKEFGKFTTVHAIDCRSENELLVAEITGWRVQKLTLQPTPATTTSAR
jgi:hypothetical protein